MSRKPMPCGKLRINLDRIPDDAIHIGKHGRTVMLYMSKMKYPDKFGNTHSASIYQTEEEHKSGDPIIHIGRLRPFNDKNS